MKIILTEEQLSNIMSHSTRNGKTKVSMKDGYIIKEYNIPIKSFLTESGVSPSILPPGRDTSEAITIFNSKDPNNTKIYKGVWSMLRLLYPHCEVARMIAHTIGGDINDSFLNVKSYFIFRQSYYFNIKIIYKGETIPGKLRVSNHNIHLDVASNASNKSHNGIKFYVSLVFPSANTSGGITGEPTCKLQVFEKVIDGLTLEPKDTETVIQNKVSNIINSALRGETTEVKIYDNGEKCSIQNLIDGVHIAANLPPESDDNVDIVKIDGVDLTRGEAIRRAKEAEEREAKTKEREAASAEISEKNRRLEAQRKEEEQKRKEVEADFAVNNFKIINITKISNRKCKFTLGGDIEYVGDLCFNGMPGNGRKAFVHIPSKDPGDKIKNALLGDKDIAYYCVVANNTINGFYNTFAKRGSELGYKNDKNNYILNGDKKQPKTIFLGFEKVKNINGIIRAMSYDVEVGNNKPGREFKI